MSKTISDLIEKVVASDTDVLLIEDNEATNKITKENFLKEINGQVDDLEKEIVEILSLNSNQNLSQNGYKILPGGLILQWNSHRLTYNNEAISSGTFSFPITFPNECLSILANVSNGSSVTFSNVQALSKSQYELKTRCITGNISGGVTSCVFAIGY